MSSNTHQTDTGTSCVTLEYTWDTEFIGNPEQIETQLENSSMGYGIAAVSITKTTPFTVDILTNMEEVVESEITAFHDEIQRIISSRMLHNATELEDHPEIRVASATIDYNAPPPFNVIDNQPSIHFAVNQSGHPDSITAWELEEHVRDSTGKLVDVQQSNGGFNVFVRDDRVSHDVMKQTQAFIRAEEDVPRNIIRVVYTAPETINHKQTI